MLTNDLIALRKNASACENARWPIVFGNALGSSLVGAMKSSGQQKDVQTLTPENQQVYNEVREAGGDHDYAMRVANNQISSDDGILTYAVGGSVDGENESYAFAPMTGLSAFDAANAGIQAASATLAATRLMREQYDAAAQARVDRSAAAYQAGIDRGQLAVLSGAGHQRLNHMLRQDANNAMAVESYATFRRSEMLSHGWDPNLQEGNWVDGLEGFGQQLVDTVYNTGKFVGYGLAYINAPFARDSLNPFKQEYGSLFEWETNAERMGGKAFDAFSIALTIPEGGAAFGSLVKMGMGGVKAGVSTTATLSRQALDKTADFFMDGLSVGNRSLSPQAGVLSLDAGVAANRVVTSSVIDGLVELDPRLIRTTQTTSKQQGATLRALTESMRKNGFVVEPDKLIDVVRMSDGGLTSLDNTRIVAADLAGVKIQARVHNFDDLLPNDDQFISRFIGRNGDVPTNWGEAVQNRISNQSALFRNTYPLGSPFISFGRNY